MSAVTESDALDLRREIVLDDAIRPATASAALGNAPRVLLTGATGFVGAHLASTLLARGAGEVLCLVRASDAQEGAQRVAANLDRYRLQASALDPRLQAVCGDLARPLLGLSAAAFASLAERVDVIVHNGAKVNLSDTYEALRATNVSGTAEILRLATTGRVKPVVHVSGMTVFLDTPSMDEQAPPPYPALRHGGYHDSKWVSERLVWEAFARGLPGSVVRIGWASGDTHNGLIASSDGTTMFLKACIRLGAAPRLPSGVLDCVPVDVVAHAIAHAALGGAPGLRGCNLWATHVFREDDLWARFAGFGRPIELLPSEAWVARLERRFPMLAPLIGSVLGEWRFPEVQDALAQRLVRSAVEVPSNDALLATYIPAWLRACGLAPQSRG